MQEYARNTPSPEGETEWEDTQSKEDNNPIMDKEEEPSDDILTGTVIKVKQRSKMGDSNQEMSDKVETEVTDIDGEPCKDKHMANSSYEDKQKCSSINNKQLQHKPQTNREHWTKEIEPNGIIERKFDKTENTIGYFWPRNKSRYRQKPQAKRCCIQGYSDEGWYLLISCWAVLF